MKRKASLTALLVLVLFLGSVPTALASEENPPWHDSYPGAIRFRSAVTISGNRAVRRYRRYPMPL